MDFFKKQTALAVKKVQEEAVKSASPHAMEQMGMAVNMIIAISDFVLAEAEKNEELKALLNLPHKSVERLLKYIWSKAKTKSTSIPGANGMGCMIADSVVMSWVLEYYNLDDKAQVEEEEKKTSEEKAKKEAEKQKDEERKATARKMAIEELSKSEEFLSKSEEDKEKEISKKASEIERDLKLKERKSSKTSKKTSKKTVSKSSEQPDSEVEVEAEEVSEIKDFSNKEESKIKETIPDKITDIAEQKPVIMSETDSCDCEQLSLF